MNPKLLEGGGMRKYWSNIFDPQLKIPIRFDKDLKNVQEIEIS